MVKMAEVQKLAEKLENDVENVKAELKRIQSVKCRLKKQKAKSTYDSEMTEVVKMEQLLKEVRDYLIPKKLTVTTMSKEDISKLNFEETIRAIKSIQSKKCLVQYATEKLEDNVEYQSALKIEEMLLEHKKTIKPVDEMVVQKSKVNDILSHLENQEGTLDKEYVLELLKKLV